MDKDYIIYTIGWIIVSPFIAAMYLWWWSFAIYLFDDYYGKAYIVAHICGTVLLTWLARRDMVKQWEDYKQASIEHDIRSNKLSSDYFDPVPLRPHDEGIVKTAFLMSFITAIFPVSLFFYLLGKWDESYQRVKDRRSYEC